MRYFHYIRKSTDDDEHQLLSLESQERENLRRFDSQPDIEILETIEESRSAKTPGRPLFNAMLDRIERGEADGIIAWHPDRLARNSVDGGRIIYLLDTGKLKDLKFATYTCENTPQGKFMLQILFANAKYHVDSMSENIRRGNRTKVENGWRPNMAPVGYLNDKKTSTIIPDPERFPLVQRLWQFMLTRAYTVAELRRIAALEWGLRTVPRKRIGGKPLTVSGLYRLFQNPFYAGVLLHEGRTYSGKHPPMVTLTQFDHVQALLGRINVPHLKKHRWTYTGLFHCGHCGLAVTASEITNRFGSKYLYYHCTRKRTDFRCRQPYVPLHSLESQIRAFIATLTISPKIHAWALRRVERDRKQIEGQLEAQRAALVTAIASNELESKNLRHLRTRDQITEAEFLDDRAAVEKERIRLARELADLSPTTALEPAESFVLFNVRALKWFDEGDEDTKRLILEAASLNPTLKDREINIDAAYPLRRWKNPSDIRELCTALNKIRTHGNIAASEKFVHCVKVLLRMARDRRIAD